MKSVKLFLLTFAFASAASAATLQTRYVPPAKDSEKQQAPMPAPADTSHYAAASAQARG